MALTFWLTRNKTDNETLLLREKETVPTNEVLENVLDNELFKIYQELISVFTAMTSSRE